MPRYEIIYLTILDKLALYHNNKLAFEGSKNDTLLCGAKLLECQQEDINNIVKDSEQAFKELNTIIDKKNKGEI